jgi:hypothetical protein
VLLQVGLGFKLAYATGNAIVLAIIYVLPTSILYTTNGRDPYENGGRSAAAEAWLWITAALSWAAYLALQGSNPGYIKRPYQRTDVSVSRERTLRSNLLPPSVLRCSSQRRRRFRSSQLDAHRPS